MILCSYVLVMITIIKSIINININKYVVLGEIRLINLSRKSLRKYK